MRIVFAAPLFPLPADGGAKIRLLRHLEVLSRKHELEIVTIVRSAEEQSLSPELKKYGEVVPIDAPHRRTLLHRAAYRFAYNILGTVRGWPPDAFYGCPGVFADTVRSRAISAAADLVHYDFWFAALGDLHAQPYRRVLLEHDVEYIRRRRDYEADERDGRLKRIWLGTERAEVSVLRSVDCVLAVTERDAQEVTEAGAHQAITLPTGIDTDRCRPPEREPEDPSLVFVGAYTHHPNVDAMVWFSHDIFPAVRAEVPDVRLSIVGSAPPPKIVDLGRLPGITVTGSVPDVAPYVQGARVAVVPLRVGSGIKGKIIEAMAFGRPVVTTPVGAEGMGLTSGQNVLIAEGEESFAAGTVRLLRDAEAARRMGEAARAFVMEHHSQDKADERLLDIYENEIWKVSRG